MKYLLTGILALSLLTSCNHGNNDKNIIKTDTAAVAEKPSFFPVTAYIKGQLHYFIERGINPLKYTTVNDRTDSMWLKVEDVDNAVKDFLTPLIDSTNLTGLYSESKFVDRSLNDAFTFTYDPIKKLPDTMQLKHWDVYIDGETGNVQRIYMVKDIPGNKQLQLTWLNNKYCKIITIANAADSTAKVEKEEKITWDL